MREKLIGYWSAVLSLLFASAYIIAGLLSTTGIIPYPYNLVWLFLPSLFLAPVFLITMVCLNHVAKPTTRIWTMIGLSFGIVYCCFVTLVCFTELAVIIPWQKRGNPGSLDVLFFDRNSYMMAINCLGYSFMSLSSFFAAFAFKGRKNKSLYRSLLAIGALFPVFVLAFFFPFFYYLAAIWIISFPFAMRNAAKLFLQVKSRKTDLYNRKSMLPLAGSGR